MSSNLFGRVRLISFFIYPEIKNKCYEMSEIKIHGISQTVERWHYSSNEYCGWDNKNIDISLNLIKNNLRFNKEVLLKTIF